MHSDTTSPVLHIANGRHNPWASDHRLGPSLPKMQSIPIPILGSPNLTRVYGGSSLWRAEPTWSGMKPIIATLRQACSENRLKSPPLYIVPTCVVLYSIAAVAVCPVTVSVCSSSIDDCTAMTPAGTAWRSAADQPRLLQPACSHATRQNRIRQRPRPVRCFTHLFLPVPRALSGLPPARLACTLGAHAASN